MAVFGIFEFTKAAPPGITMGTYCYFGIILCAGLGAMLPRRNQPPIRPRADYQLLQKLTTREKILWIWRTVSMQRALYGAQMVVSTGLGRSLGVLIMSGLSTSRWMTIIATQGIITLFWLILYGSLSALLHVVDDIRGELTATELSLFGVAGVAGEILSRRRFDLLPWVVSVGVITYNQYKEATAEAPKRAIKLILEMATGRRIGQFKQSEMRKLQRLALAAGHLIDLDFLDQVAKLNQDNMVKLMLKNRTTERASSYEEVYRAATSLGKQNLTRVLAAEIQRRAGTGKVAKTPGRIRATSGKDVANGGAGGGAPVSRKRRVKGQPKAPPGGL